MSFGDDFGQCVKDNLPEELVDVMKDLTLEKVVELAYKLAGGASVEETLIAVGVGAEAAAAAAAAVAGAGIAIAVIVSAIISGCVVSATAQSMWDAMQSAGSSVFDTLKDYLTAAGYTPPADAAAA